MKHWKKEYKLIQSITGFGPVLSCNIIAHILPSNRKHLRWALVQAANAAGRTNTKLGCYYGKKKEQKNNAGIAHVAVASGMIDIICKMLSTNKPYNPKIC